MSQDHFPPGFGFFGPNGLPALVQGDLTGLPTPIVGSTTLFNGVGFRLATRRISDGQIKSLSTVPILDFIPAASAGTIVVPHTLWLHQNLTTGYSAGPTWVLRYTTNATPMFSITPTLATPGKKFYTLAWGGGASIDYGNGTPVGTAIRLSAAADVTVGNAANFVDVFCLFFIMGTAVV
jgi:hypothetical protein